MRADVKGSVMYPFECAHSAPPCGTCSQDKVWSQFDPERGSMRQTDLRPERDILLSIESLLKKLVDKK